MAKKITFICYKCGRKFKKKPFGTRMCQIPRGKYKCGNDGCGHDSMMGYMIKEDT